MLDTQWRKLFFDASLNWQYKYSTFVNRKLNLQKYSFSTNSSFQYSEVFNFVGTKILWYSVNNVLAVAKGSKFQKFVKWKL